MIAVTKSEMAQRGNVAPQNKWISLLLLVTLFVKGHMDRAAQPLRGPSEHVLIPHVLVLFHSRRYIVCQGIACLLFFSPVWCVVLLLFRYFDYHKLDLSRFDRE